MQLQLESRSIGLMDNSFPPPLGPPPPPPPRDKTKPGTRKIPTCASADLNTMLAGKLQGRPQAPAAAVQAWRDVTSERSPYGCGLHNQG